MSRKRSLSVSVRDLVEFVLRTGNLGGEGDFVSPLRAHEGSRGHRRIQKSRPPGYASEVTVSRQIETESFVLIIKGRIDGVLTAEGMTLIEEIKTVTRRWDAQPDPLHWAQGKIYGFLYLRDHALEQIDIQLTYLDLESDGLTVFRQSFAAAALSRFFEEVTGVYLQWAKDHDDWRGTRDQSIGKLAFPFAEYRTGQRTLAVAAYRAFAQSGRLFAEAPTGIGKTISVLFPAVKALAEGHADKIFYLTAKTSGRTAAEKALADLRAAGLRLRALTLTAKDKICFNEGQPCDVATCPFALGYYDRAKGAVREALRREVLSKSALEEVARQHHVCPFALSLDVSLWVDAIVCDYNYVFDPKVLLRRFFTEEGGPFVFLVDEAHNLVDRAREMFSADLDKVQIVGVKRSVQKEAPACAKALDKVNRYFLGLRHKAGDTGYSDHTTPIVTKEAPEGLIPLLRTFLREADAWLIQDHPSASREDLLELYFRVNGFARTAELYDERYVTILEGAGEEARLRLFCLDPSFLLHKALKRGQAAVFFSATLSPLDYFREVSGGTAGDAVLELPSPLPVENLRLLIADRIATNLRERATTFDEVAHAIAAVVRAKRGNYLVYFPSYTYLEQVLERFTALHSDLRTLRQAPSMSENERAAFLGEFHTEHRQTLAGFAVLGGVFGEGIDLVGDRLIGAVIVGVGLPQLCVERDLIRDYFQRKNALGFDYAYTYPGLNRVLQAVGRVIRSERDRGVALLIDTRFSQQRYRRLFPSWWRPEMVRSAEQIEEEVRRFWNHTGSLS